MTPLVFAGVYRPVAYAPTTAFSSLPVAIAAGGSPSPAPTTATATDWHRVYVAWTYTIAGKDDNSSADWTGFTIVVNYTPVGADTGPNKLTLLGVG